MGGLTVKDISLLRTVRFVTLPITLLVLWQLFGAAQPPNSNIPMPSAVVEAAVNMISTGDILLAMSVSIRRVIAGFAIASGLGIPLGLAMGYSRVFEHNTDPVFQTFRMVAPIALVPLAIVWFGPKGNAAIFIVAYGTFFPIVVNTIHGVKEVDPLFVRAAQTMGLRRGQVIRNVTLPGALPSIYLGARIAMGVAWGAIVAAELTVGFKALPTALGGARRGAGGGIGFMMFYLYDNSVNVNSLIVTMVAVGVVALATDRLLRLIGRKGMPWARL